MSIYLKEPFIQAEACDQPGCSGVKCEYRLIDVFGLYQGTGWYCHFCHVLSKDTPV